MSRTGRKLRAVPAPAAPAPGPGPGGGGRGGGPGGGGQEDPAPALHPVNVAAWGFTYSTGDPGCCGPCGALARGLYQASRGDSGPGRFVGPLPYVRYRSRSGPESALVTMFLLSRDPDGRAVMMTGDEIDSGYWADRVGMARSSDRKIRDALGSAVRELAELALEIRGTPRPKDRTPDGHIPVPDPNCLGVPGYFRRPEDYSAETMRRAELVVASVASRRPAIAWNLGASVAAPFVAIRPVTQSAVIDLSGPSRRGKTVTLCVAGWAWGDCTPPPNNAESVIGTFDVSPLGAPRVHGLLGIFPAFWDETGASGLTPEQRNNWIMRTCQGNSRLRPSRTNSMALDPTLPWAGFGWMTGNSPVATERLAGGIMQGIPARVISLADWPLTAAPLHDGLEGPGWSEADRLMDSLLKSYGRIGPAALAAFTPDEFEGLFRAALVTIGAPAAGVVGTRARHLAAGVAGAMMADRMLGTGTRLADAALKFAREWLGLHMAPPKSDADRLLEAIKNAITDNPARWPTPENLAIIVSRGQPIEGVRDTAAGYVYVKSNTWERLEGGGGRRPFAGVRGPGGPGHPGCSQVHAGRRGMGGQAAPSPGPGAGCPPERLPAPGGRPESPR